jgi:predicted DNA-binding protein
MSAYTEPKVVVSAQIPREQREELERRAAENDRTVSWYVRRAVDRYLESDHNEVREEA